MNVDIMIAIRETQKFAFCAAMVLGVTAAEGALRAWEPGDYAQDGLALHYDGIRNAGADAAHDSESATWTDLSGNGRDAALNVADGATGNVWKEDGFYFNAGADFCTSATFALGTNYTMEILADAPGGAGQPNGFGTFIAPYIGANKGAVLYKQGSKTLLHQTDDLIGNVWDTRPGIYNPATFTYLTAARNGSRACVFTGVEYPSNEENDDGAHSMRSGWSYGTKNLTAAASMWTVGGYRATGGVPNDAYYLKGTVKSVRVYDRLLSEAELAWNRALDEVRFMNGAHAVAAEPVASAVPDAVIATSLAGANGVEACGSYVVDKEKGHVFAAVSAVVGGTSYVCTGYTLESWDADAGAWGAPVPHPGAYSCFVAAGDKVRITWQWSAAPGTLALAVSGYVQDGLVMHFDGLRNAGANCRDPSATVWKDLSGSGNDLTLHYYDGEGAIHDGLQGGYWTNDGFYFDGASYGATISNVDLGTDYTIEILCDATPSTQEALALPDGGAFFCSDNMANGSIWYKRLTGIQFWANDVVGTAWDTRSQLPDSTWTYVVGVRKGNRTTLFSGAALPADDNLDRRTGWAVGTKSTSAGNVKWYVGGRRCVGTDYANKKGQCIKGVIKSVRVYNRVLADEELARNREVDEARFNAAKRPGSVMVADSSHGCTGREPSGDYMADGWTFSAGTCTNTLLGISWICDGCTVQTWNSETWQWVHAETLSATEWTAPSGTDFAPRRLTWHWKPVRGMRSAASYDVGDYVRGGMTLHLDGIRNAGAGVAHDSAATTWVDLSGHGRDATLNVADGGQGNAWCENGFVFNASADFSTAAAFALGTHSTMEFLADVSYGSQGTETFGTFIAQYGGVNKGSVLIKKQDSTLLYQTDDLIGNVWDTRPGLYQPPLISRLVTARDGRRASMFTGVEYPTNMENEKANARCIGWSYGTVCNVASASRWTVGGYRDANGDPDTARFIKGTIRSVRVYDRLLTEEDMAWNRKVDEARFFGALSVTNVVVAGKFSDYAGTAPGAYEVFGSYTFTASDAVGDDGRTCRILGYTLQEWNGSTWGAVEEHAGASYEHVVGTSPAKVLLTWRWQSAGTMVIFR